MALTEAAFYDFFRKIVLQPDGITLEADHTKDELTITRGPGVAFNPTEGTDSFEIDVDYSLYVPVGSTSVTLRDVNAGESNISITAGSNIVVSRVSDNELEIIATVGGASKSISNISTTNPVVVTTTSSHSYTESSEVTITDVVGMTEVNGNEYYMDILTGNTFALYSDPLLTTPVDGTAFTPYSTGGVATVDYTAVKLLESLTDTTFTNPQNNDLITYNNGVWVNTNSITATLIGNVTGNLDGIVGGTTPAAGTFSTLRTSETAIRLGNTAGSITPGTYSIAIGDGAGENSQGNYSVAIGKDSAQLAQLGAVAIGYQAGQAYQKNLSVAIGNATGNTNQGFFATAVGSYAGNTGQNDGATAVGHYAGESNQGADAIAIGRVAGQTNQAANSIVLNATGNALENTTASSFVVKPIRQTDGPYYLKYEPTNGEISYASASDFVVGDLQGSVFGDDSTILVDGVNNLIPASVINGTITNDISTSSLRTSDTSIDLGFETGLVNPGTNRVAIGRLAGRNTQGASTIAIGDSAGRNFQGASAIAIGGVAGYTNQAGTAIAIGGAAGYDDQTGTGAIAIGFYAGYSQQTGNYSISLGSEAGRSGQGQSAIAIGHEAGYDGTANPQVANSIAIIASDASVTIDQAGLFIDPIRNVSNTNFLTYNTTSKEITYASASTTNVSEGTNLYYTDARAQTATTGRAIAMSMIFGG